MKYCCSIVAIAAVLLGILSQIGAAEMQSDSFLVDVLRQELAQAEEQFARIEDQAPLFYLQYQVIETERLALAAEYGAVSLRHHARTRNLQVDLRVGSPELDNTHPIRGQYDQRQLGHFPISLPLDNDEAAVRLAVWRATDAAYKEAQERLINVQTNAAIKVEEEDQALDFAADSTHIHHQDNVPLNRDEQKWSEDLRRWSALFSDYPDIHSSTVAISIKHETRILVNSEGSEIVQTSTRSNLSIHAQTTADDGMELFLAENIDGRDIASMPGEQEIQSRLKQLADDLIALRQAPVAEPYIGPAILHNRACGVFFHEIFGHRIEGHRQKNTDDGQTFTKKLGEPILPRFISVFDDPTLEYYGNEELNGSYQYDDEGVAAQRVPVVENGILRNFLQSRSPSPGFEHSNGHGRRSSGYDVTSRQGNLIIESSRTMPFEQLRAEMLEACRTANKPYGLIFENIAGGFTQTQRFSTQGFKVLPLLVKRAYTDGRPDELVRGVDIVGTPLTAFSKIMATGDDPAVFNGICGAESGWVPVSAVSPSILVSEIETAKKIKGEEKPPLLPPPAAEKESR